jgi:hypothetical protein
LDYTRFVGRSHGLFSPGSGAPVRAIFAPYAFFHGQVTVSRWRGVETGKASHFRFATLEFEESRRKTMRFKETLMLALFMAWSGCGKKDDKQVPATPDPAKIQGYWLPTLDYDEGMMKDSMEEAWELATKDGNALFFQGDIVSTASNGDDAFKCPVDRKFTILQEAGQYYLEMDEAENCQKARFALVNLDGRLLKLTKDNHTYVFSSKDPGEIESYVSSHYTSDSGINPSFKKLYIAPPDQSTIDAHIADSRKAYQNLLLVVSETSAVESFDVLVEGELLPRAKNQIEARSARIGDRMSCFVSRFESAKFAKDRREELRWVTIGLPRPANNQWTFLANPDLQALRMNGATDAEIEAVKNRERLGDLVTQKTWKNRVTLESENITVRCEKPLSQGLISFAEVQKTLGSHIQLVGK